MKDQSLHYNVYRMTKYCNNCPFINRKALHISSERLQNIKTDLDKGGSFICHKTAYPDVFNTDPNIGKKMCKGAYDYMVKKGIKSPQMQVAERMGVETE